MEEVNPSRGTVECGEGLPLLDGAQEARAKQRTGVAEEVCRDHGVLWVQLPDEGNGVKDLLRVAEEAAKGGPAPVVPLWYAVDNSVAPRLPLLPAAARSSNVPSLSDVDCRSPSLREAAVSDEAGRNEMRRWRWYRRSGVGSAVRGGGRSNRSTVVRWVGRR